MLKTRVGRVAVTVAKAPNGDWQWATEQVSDGYPTGQGRSKWAWGAITSAVWHGHNIHRAATDLQHCIDHRAASEQMLTSVQHYCDTVADDRLDTYLQTHTPDAL